MENKSCLICAWREFCAKKEITEARYCPDFTLDVAFSKSTTQQNLKQEEQSKEDSHDDKRTDSK